MFTVAFEDIERLTDVQLTEVLKYLLYAESDKHNLYGTVHVSLKIDVPDGGEDGFLEWKGGPSKILPFLPSRKVLFQCKATAMPPSKCREEILTPNGKVKPQVEKVLETSEGSYVLFHSRALNRAQINERIKQFRTALRAAGKPYADTATIVILDANLIADWVNRYFVVLALIYIYQYRPIPLSLKTWKFWSTHIELNRFDYVPSSLNQTSIIKIRESFLGQDVKQIRIIGLSGLGKTRLALEVFRPRGVNSVEDELLSKNTVYINMDHISAEALISSVQAWVNSETFGILIIDNCSYSLHLRLVQETQYMHSRLKLLTLNFEPTQTDIPGLIRFQPETDDIIEKMLLQTYPDITPPNLARIVKFAQGFPEMAMLLAKSPIDDLILDLIHVPDSELVKRLLWGRNPVNEEIKAVLSVCALFDEFGWIETKHYKIITEISGVSVSDRMVHSWISDYHIRGLMITHDDALLLSPKPLALRLAAEWLEKQPGPYLLKMIEKLPHDLLQQFAKQFSLLDFLPKAKEITAQLCDAKREGLFTQPGIIATPHGTFLLCSLIDVDPAAACATLMVLLHPLPNIDTTDIKVINNLTLAMEKLCFRHTVFTNACPLFLDFVCKMPDAVRDDVKRSFLQLFQIEHSGTETPLDEKLAVIRRILSADIPLPHRKIIIEALGRAIQCVQLPRASRAEFQGSGKVLVEWSPKSLDHPDVIKYRRDALQMLLDLANSHDEFGMMAYKIMVFNRLEAIIAIGFLPEIITQLSTAINAHRSIAHNAREKFMEIIATNSTSLSAANITALQKLAERSNPTVATVVNTPLAKFSAITTRRPKRRYGEMSPDPDTSAKPPIHKEFKRQ